MKKPESTAKRKPLLKKETVRKLGVRVLSDDELAQAAGGGYPKPSYCCGTCN